MAKRRNLKKEKAARNRAYARQFRSSSYRGHSNKQREQKPEGEQKSEDNN